MTEIECKSQSAVQEAERAQQSTHEQENCALTAQLVAQLIAQPNN